MPRRVRPKANPGPQLAKGLKSWSYSTYNMWSQCPRRIYYAKIEKRPDPLGAAAQKGIKVHAMAEHFIKGEIDRFPEKGVGKALNAWVEDLTRLRESPTAKSELDFTFTEDWQQTHWRDWDNAWVRMKIDAFDRPEKDTVVVIDFKTGRRRDYDKQLELYALASFKAYPQVERAVAEIWYIDEGAIGAPDAVDGIEFTKDEEPELQAKWDERAGKLMADTEFRATGQGCDWCPFSNRKGGPCERG